MTEIAASSLGGRLDASVLALKLQLQRESDAATSLVEQAVRSAEEATTSTAAKDRLVDVLV